MQNQRSTSLRFGWAAGALAAALAVAPAAHAKRQVFELSGLDVDIPDGARVEQKERFIILTLDDRDPGVRGAVLTLHTFSPSNQSDEAVVKTLARALGSEPGPVTFEGGLALHPAAETVGGVLHRGVFVYRNDKEGSLIVKAVMPSASFTPELVERAKELARTARLRAPDPKLMSEYLKDLKRRTPPVGADGKVAQKPSGKADVNAAYEAVEAFYPRGADGVVKTVNLGRAGAALRSRPTAALLCGRGAFQVFDNTAVVVDATHVRFTLDVGTTQYDGSIVVDVRRDGAGPFLVEQVTCPG